MSTTAEKVKIKVEGAENMYDFEQIKSSVVSIANKFYFRHDIANVVCIKNDEGKNRFYRTNSPLICKDTDGNTILKTQAYYSAEDGLYLNKKSSNVVEIDKKFYRKAYCIKVANEWYLKSDPRLVTCPITGEQLLKNTAIELSEKYYKQRFVSKAVTTVKTIDGELIAVKDKFERFDTATVSVVIHHRSESIARNEPYQNVLYDFQDKTNPQEERLVFKNVLVHECINSANGVPKTPYMYYSFIEGHSTFLVHSKMLPYFEEAKNTYILPRYLEKIALIKEKINQNYSDLDATENVAIDIHHITKPFAGKSEIRRSRSFGIPIKSTKFDLTGGLKYSFGVEIETSDGLLSSETVDKLGIYCVGDRSIGSGEYVTSPMTGDAGVLMLKTICKKLNESTLVDDRCGIHVHVGSLFKPTVKIPVPSANEAPSFSKQFLINSINLGAYLEEELFKSLPKNRKPTLYHCHSIRRFAGINKTNFDTYLGAYIFGPKEWWLEPNDQCHTKLFNFEDYKLNNNRNHTSQLGTWAEGRYKWLNLIPSYTATPHRTIEFRIFSGSTNFEKIYMYLLTSLAFTWFADNCTKKIVKGVTLSQVFDAAYKDYPELINTLNTFYAKRTARFARKEIYPKLDLPFLK